MIRKLAKRLDKLKAEWPISQRIRAWLGSRDRTYDKLVVHLQNKISRMESLAAVCLRTADASGLQTYIEIFELLVSHVNAHVPSVVEMLGRVQTDTRIRFEEISKDATKALNSGDFMGFENSFPGIRLYILNVQLIMNDHKLMEKFRLINQLIFESVRTRVQMLTSMIEIKTAKVDFLAIRAAIQDTRDVGDFVADHCTLFFAEMAASTHLDEDPWLSKILALCKEHFSAGRDFKHLAQCAIFLVWSLPRTSRKSRGLIKQKPFFTTLTRWPPRARPPTLTSEESRRQKKC